MELIRLDAPKFEPAQPELKPLSELLSPVLTITADIIEDWGEEQGWTYDDSNLDGRATGWDVTAEESEALLDDRLTEFQGQVLAVSEQLLDSGDVQEWEDAIAVIILALSLGAYGLGKGGREQISAADIDYLQNRIRNQMTFLRGFSEGIAAEELTRRQILNRASYYPQDSRLNYDQGIRASYTAANWYWEKNVLSAAEHCTGCLDAAAQGWQPIGTLPPLGSRQCRFNELCHWEFGQSVERPTDSLKTIFIPRWGWLNDWPRSF